MKTAVALHSILILLLMTACASAETPAATATQRPSPTVTAVPTSVPTTVPAAVPTSDTFAILYHVSGSALTASLTYQNATGGTEQHDVVLPWEQELTMRHGDFVYLSAQNNGDSGTVGCLIIANDSIKIANAVSGDDYGIVTCSGSVGMGD